MKDTFNATAAIVGLVVIALASLLPIDAGDVRDQTGRRLAGDVLAELRPEGAPAPLPVRVSVTGAAPDALTMAAVLKTPTVDTPDGFAPIFVDVDDPAAPLLTLTVLSDDARLTVQGKLGEAEARADARLASWLSLLPPLVALVVALSARSILIALLLAVLVGAAVLRSSPLTALWAEAKGLVGALLGWIGVDAVEVEGYLGGVIADTFNLQILGFTFALVGLVAVVGRMGGTRGLVLALSRLARGPRSAQAVTSLMGTAVFFDDYANTVVVGTTARSLTDDHKISREKLAYIVDSTSAPVAGVAIISTWIGYEVGLFDDLLGVLSSVPGLPSSGYELFFEILPLRFYCLFALALVYLNAWTGRDLGPMYRAEYRTRHGGPLTAEGERAPSMSALEKPGVPPRALNAIIPIGGVLLAIFGWILTVGTAALPSFDPLALADWKAVFDVAADDIAFILLGSALVGSVIAFVLAIGQRLLTPKEAVVSYFHGLRTLVEAAAILVLAWAIKAVCDDLGTGTAMVALVGDALPAILLPLVVFVLSGAVAFSTGTSWGTMALVLPVAAPLAAQLSGDSFVVLMCLGAVLDGAIWGDHCSPISDTTVLSSTASGCPHLDHVKTQLPYAMLAMAAAGLCGYLGMMVGLPLPVAYLVGLGLMLGGLLLFGRDPSVGVPTLDKRAPGGVRPH